MLPVRSIWVPKLREFLDGPDDIAFLQATDVAETRRWASAMRSAKKILGLTGDDLRVTQNIEQLRVYVAKRLVPKRHYVLDT